MTVCDAPGKRICGLHCVPRHPQRFPECTNAAQRSMTLLLVLVPAEQSPWSSLGTRLRTCPSKARSLWQNYSLTPVYRAVVKKQYRQCLDAQDTHELEKVLLDFCPFHPW